MSAGPAASRGGDQRVMVLVKAMVDSEAGLMPSMELLAALGH
jgi:hypothetical protein